MYTKINLSAPSIIERGNEESHMEASMGKACFEMGGFSSTLFSSMAARKMISNVFQISFYVYRMVPL